MAQTKKLLGILFAIGILPICSSCQSVKTIYFQCDRQDIQLYVNDEFIGSGQGYYTIPKGMTEVAVSCMEEGRVVYRRNFYVKGNKENLYELNIPKDYGYSSGNTITSKPK